MRFLNAFIVLFCFCSTANAQLDGLFITSHYQKTDFFASVEGGFKLTDKFTTRTGLGAGIRRTFLQQRFFPQLNQAINWNVINQEKRIKFGPELSFGLSRYKITDKVTASYLTGRLGYFFCYNFNSNWAIFQTTTLAREREYLSIGSQVNYWTINGSLGVKYDWKR